MNDNDHYRNLLLQNKYYVVPSFNVDGVKFIEDKYKETGVMEPKRTSMHIRKEGCSDLGGGVDLNRNYDFNFGQGHSSATECVDGADNYRGPSGFSEPET